MTTCPPNYLIISTLIFTVIPIVLMVSIFLAKRGFIALHSRLQLAVYALMLINVAIFEIGIRLDGSFMHYVQSDAPYFTAFIIYLIVHILIAAATVVYWTLFLYRSLKAYRDEGQNAAFFTKHRRLGYRLFAAITLTSLMGLSIFFYIFRQSL